MHDDFYVGVFVSCIFFVIMDFLKQFFIDFLIRFRNKFDKNLVPYHDKIFFEENIFHIVDGCHNCAFSYDDDNLIKCTEAEAMGEDTSNVFICSKCKKWLKE